MSNVRVFGAAGDGQTDDTEALVHALKDGDGVLEFPPGDYLISKTITVELKSPRRFGMVGSAGAAKIIMAGPGPAFHLLGTHGGTADPEDFQPDVWAHQRMPTLLNLEIEGRHPEADGLWVEGAMQTTLEGVLLRELRDAVRVVRRARNLLISHTHIYNNRRYGIHVDRANLHQAIVTGSHISYNRQAGIKIEGGQIRNVQITGNDIEYNYHRDLQGCADVLLDCSAEGATIREGTLVSNTVQAVYSPGGANVRLIGQNPEHSHSVGMFTISGNLIGSQETNVHLVSCRGVVVEGNVIYSGHRRNLLVEGSRNIVVGPNSFDHNPDYREKELCTGVRLADSHDVTLTGLAIADCQAGRHTVQTPHEQKRQGLLEIVGCRRVTASGLHVTDGAPCGIYLENASNVNLSGCTVLETREHKLTEAAIRWTGQGSGNLISGCRAHSGTQAALQLGEEAGVTTVASLAE